MKSRLYAHIGTIRQLEIILAVYEQGSISQAAKTLHLTQPTVSMQLAKLAQAIEMPLYNQVGRKLIFTEAGIEMVKGAEAVLNNFAELDTRLADLKGIKKGTLKLGVVTTAKYFIPHILGAFCQQFPGIDIELNIGNRSQIIERLWQAKDDYCVFSHPPKSDFLELTEFLPNPLVAIAHDNHPLTKENNISLKRFSKEPFIMREVGSGTRFTIEESLKALKINLNVKMIIESNEAIKHSVMSGLGVSILSKHTLAFGGQEGLRILDVNELPLSSNWFLAKLDSVKPSIVAKAFFDHVEKHGRNAILELLDIGVSVEEKS